MNIHDQLRRPFELTKIHWRVGSMTKDKSKGMALAYIDARDVMSRLDSVVGTQNWQCRYPISDNGLLICEVGIREWIDVHEEPPNHVDWGTGWIWKANGAGDTQVEAEKGKCSDAMKRAAVLWGVGQYLYALPNRWFPLDDWKRLPKKR